MSLSRKRQRELNQLKRQAEQLWGEQQEVFDRMGSVIREAGRQAGNYAREEVRPRVTDAYESGVGAVRGAAQSIGDRVVPAVTGAAASALAAIDVLRDRQLRAALAGANRFGHDIGERFGLVKPAPIVVQRHSAAPWIFATIGAIAVGVVGYAVWQTLRADDGLWVEEDSASAEDPVE